MSQKKQHSICLVNNFAYSKSKSDKVVLVTNKNIFDESKGDVSLHLSDGSIINLESNEKPLCSHLFSDPEHPEKSPVQLLLDREGLGRLIDVLTATKEKMDKVEIHTPVINF